MPDTRKRNRPWQPKSPEAIRERKERQRYDARAREIAAFHAELRARFQIPVAPAEYAPSLIEVLSQEA